MKKRGRYMSDETFSELVESLEQAIQHERGERNDLRVTILPAPPRPGSKPASAPIEDDSEEKLKTPYAEFADEDRALVEEGMDDYLKNLMLEELLEGITEKNRHEEINTGLPVGKEEW